MNILGPAHVLELVIPKIEEILAIVNINYVIVNEKQGNNEDQNSRDEENKNLNINGKTNKHYLNVYFYFNFFIVFNPFISKLIFNF